MNDKHDERLSNTHQDDAMDRDLQQLSQRYRDARDMDDASAIEPPAFLDKTILAAAHREVGAKPVSLNKSRFSRWQVPLATAAVVLISTTVAFVGIDEKPDVLTPTIPRESQVPAPIMAVSPSAKASADRAQDAKTVVATNEPALPASSPSGLAPEVDKRQAHMPARVKTPVQHLPVQTDRKPSRQAEVVKSGSREGNESPKATLSTQDLRYADQVLAETAQEKKDVAVSGAAINKKSIASAPEPRLPQATAMGAPAVATAPPPAPISAVQIPAEPAAASMADQRDLVQKVAPKTASSSSAVMKSAPAARMAENRPPVAQSERSEESLEEELPLTPDAWLKQIEQLYQQGKLEEARVSLQKFRQKYPQHKVPDILLRELIPAPK